MLILLITVDFEEILIFFIPGEYLSVAGLEPEKQQVSVDFQVRKRSVYHD